MVAMDEAVWSVAVLLLGGVVLQVQDVSAGRGKVIDWRTVKSGETLVEGADAFDTAHLFVALVGPDAAMKAMDPLYEPALPPGATMMSVRVTAFAPQANGGRNRTFEAGGFEVMVRAHEDDDAQAAFTEELARLAATISASRPG